jgi:hypothetical protein
MELRANDKGSDIYAVAFFICTGTNGSDQVNPYERGQKRFSAVSHIINCAIKGREVDCAKELALMGVREHLYRVKLLGNRQCFLGDWYNVDFGVHAVNHCATLESEHDWLLALQCMVTSRSIADFRY